MVAINAGAPVDAGTRFTTVFCNQTRYRTVASERKGGHLSPPIAPHPSPQGNAPVEPTRKDATQASVELYETFVNLGGHIQCDQPYTRLTVGLVESPRRTEATAAGYYCIVGVRCQPAVTAYTLVLQRDDQPPVRQKYALRPCVAIVCP